MSIQALILFVVIPLVVFAGIAEIYQKVTSMNGGVFDDDNDEPLEEDDMLDPSNPVSVIYSDPHEYISDPFGE